MNDVFDELESQLSGAIRARRRTRPRWPRRGHRRTPVLVLIAVLVISAGALAAGGVIRIGSPAERHTSSFYAQEDGAIVKGAVRLLPISTSDPAGGLPWGMRVLSTERGEGCVQVGRLLDGKLGALGQDSAFRDDRLFHEFSPNTFGAERACTLLDGNDRLFINATVGDIPASAWRGNFPDKGCVPSTAGPYERFAEDGKRKPYPVCPQDDERNLYYGLLGPDAQSVTYKLDGQTHTQATAGPEGAYLIVTKASPTQLFNFNAGGTQGVVPVDGPITELHYRDGATCHLTARSWIGGKEACTPALKVPIGWVRPRTPTPTAAQVAAPLHVSLIRAPKGRYALRISFSSRIAIADAHSTYTIRWRQPGMPPNVYGGALLTPAFPRVGQTVTGRIGDYGRALRPGMTTGEIIYQDQAGPGNLEEAGGTVQHTVGRFTVHVP